MIERDLVIVGDEAWLREEYEAELRHQQQHREGQQRRRAARAEQLKAWRAANPERVRVIRRQSAWRHRRHPVGSLHGLACSGPTKATGCRCSKIVMYDKP